MNKGTLLILLAAAFVVSGCSAHPSYQTRIKKMDQVIKDEGYQTRGRPFLSDRYLDNTGKIR